MFSMDEAMPLLIVFGLDKTLWPFWTDGEIRVKPPFTKISPCAFIDIKGRAECYFRDVPEILSSLQKKGVKTALTCTTSEVDAAWSLLHLFEWKRYFTYFEIFPSTDKIGHFYRLRETTGVHYTDMLFFDNIIEHVQEISALGVLSIRVDPIGLTKKILEEGLEHYRNHKKGKQSYTVPSIL